MNLLASLRGSDYIIIQRDSAPLHFCAIAGVRHVVSEGIHTPQIHSRGYICDGSSLLIVRTESNCHALRRELVSSDARIFQHIAEFAHDLTIARGNLKSP